MIDNSRMGRFIATKRKALGLTQQQLAGRLNVSFQAVSKWENGNNVPDIMTLMELANFFNVSVDELLGFDLSSKNIDDMVDSIEDLYHAYRFDEAVSEANNALVRYPDVHFVFISPPELKVPDYITDNLDELGIPYEEHVRLEDAISKLDILYMTRIQKERFFNEDDYVRLKNFYILDAEKMKLAKKDCYVLHPLPRVNEIAAEVDSDPRAAYFRQVQYGVYVRMALILTLLNIHID